MSTILKISIIIFNFMTFCGQVLKAFSELALQMDILNNILLIMIKKYDTTINMSVQCMSFI